MGSFEVQSGGATLCSEVHGEGTCVIMLHAGVCDRRMWRQAIPPIAGRFKVVTYDRRGFGDTTTPDEAFSHVEDLAKIIEHVEAKKPVLSGCSQGGRIAIDYALANPEKVSALVLISTSITGSPPPEAYPPDIEDLFEKMKAAEAAGDLDWVNEIEARIWLDGPMNTPVRVGGKLREAFLEMNGKALQHPALTMEQQPPSALEHMHKIRVPTYLIWGAGDFAHVRALSLWLTSKLPIEQSLIMKNCAHLPSFENPAQFSEAVVAFLAKYGIK